MLRNGPTDVTSRFDKVIDAADHGESLANAWSAIMVPDGYRWLNAKLRDYLAIDHLALLRAPYRAHAANVKPTQRTISDTETHLLWARLVDWRREEGNRGLAQLEAATKQDPGSPEVIYWRAVARFRRHELDGAIELFRAAITEAPTEPRYLFGLGFALQEKYADDRSPQNFEAIGDVVTALEPVAVSSAQLTFLANWYDSKRKRDHAAELADRAMKINPSCVGCADTRARIAFNDGFLDDAIRLERRAIALLPDGANDQPLQKTLSEYEAAAKAKAATAPPASATSPAPIAN